MSIKLRVNKVVSFLVSLVILVSLVHVDLIVHIPSLRAEQTEGFFITRDGLGINVTLPNRYELYFNVSNGGEITRYYDLSSDPLRTSNLVLPANQSFQQPSPHNLYPLFSSILYNPYIKDFRAVGSTGGDGNASLTVLGNGRQDGLDYVILQATARIMDVGGGVFEDVYGDANYVKSTWLIRSDGYMFVERTLYTPEYAVIQGKFRWYPFYLIRTTGFSNTATFYLFNTTYAFTYNVSRQTYRNDYASYPELPPDETGHLGVAAPFSNTNLGGDGTDNIILVYDFADSNIMEWKADCFTNADGFGGTEFGAVHEFDTDYNITKETYRAMIVLTHDPISEQNVMTFARYFSNNPAFPLARANLITNKVFYDLGEPFIVNVSATFDYNMVNLDRILTLTDEFGRTLWYGNFGRVNASQDETWSNVQLLNQTISGITTSDDYTFTFSLVSTQGIVISSDSVNVIVTVRARQFGKTEVGQHNATSYKDYKMISRYMMSNDGWITSISMWFGNQGFEAKVAIYTHPEGRLIVQSQSEAITSIGWHTFTIPRTFLFSGLYGLSWKNSQNAIAAYDAGLSDQTARTPELYSYSFSSTFGSPEIFPVETSIYATYDSVVAKLGVSSYVQTPSYDEDVTVIAHARDGGILTGPVVLSYLTSANDRELVSVTMTSNEGLYTAKIPPQRYNTIVYYKVHALDSRGEPIGSEMYSYKVTDFQPPIISYLERTPVSPSYNETVVISANVNEPILASGIKLVLLTYWNGFAWTNITMVLEDGLYTAVIPTLPFGTPVSYIVRAFDYAQNTGALDIYTYEVTDRFPPMAKIDGLSQSSVKGVVPVNVMGDDANFDRMELYISEQLAQTWNQSSYEIYYWDTTKYADGTYLVKLRVYDKAGNIGEKEISTTIDNTVPGWTLSFIAVFALIAATLIGTMAYSTKRRREGRQFSTNASSSIEIKAVKIVVRLAIILPAIWYGFWIAAEVLVWRKPLNVALTTSLINDFGFAFAILLLILYESWQRRRRTNFTPS